MIITALKPYKALRFQQSIITVKRNITDITKLKSKHFYKNMVIQKTIKPKTTKKWEEEFSCQVSWPCITKNKLSKHEEIKIKEFNYKFLMNIVATKDNLFRWKKSNNKFCIYCTGNLVHNTKHLLWECSHVHGLWNIISAELNIDITWKNIVIGINNKVVENIIISIICYCIYKKFIRDNHINTRQYELLTEFLSRELLQKSTIYTELTDHVKKGVAIIMKTIVDRLAN